MGISVPLAPVLVRAYFPPHPAETGESREWDVVFHPAYCQTTWFTTRLESVQPYRDFELVSVIGEEGDDGNFGFGIPKGAEKPFFFYWVGFPQDPRITPVDGVEARRFSVDPRNRDSNLSVFEVYHPFVAANLPQERYLLICRKDGDVAELLQDHMVPASLMSGSDRRGFGSRLAVWMQPRLPFEYLIGLNQPGLHNLIGREKPREKRA